MSRTTRSLILDDDIWDSLHNSWMEEQLTSGERLTKTDFVERVFRLGLSAATRGRSARRPALDVTEPRSALSRGSARRSDLPASAPTEQRRDEPAGVGIAVGATTDAPRTPQQPSPIPRAAKQVAGEHPPARKRSLDRLMNMSRGGDPSQISSAADRRSPSQG